MSTNRSIRVAGKANHDGYGHAAADLLRANLRDLRKPAKAHPRVIVATTKRK